MNTFTTYELFVHYKQGDDLNHHLNSTSNTSDALESWANSLAAAVEQVRKLASLLRGTDVTAQANTHLIMFEGDPTVLEAAAQAGLLDTFEIPCDDDEAMIESELCGDAQTNKIALT